MLRKILKYDFKFLFKYWWIGAVISLSLSVASGFCIRLLDTSLTERELPAVVNSSATSVIALSIISYIAFSIIAMILIFIRFYKNFFSDEGYLTFTLPVKRTHLINSKIITSVIIELATFVLIGLSVAFMIIIGFWEDFWTAKTWDTICKIFEFYFKDHVLCRVAYIIEALILIVLSVIFSNLFLFCCITFASIITKKARVITAIGIYYGVNMVISFAMQIFMLFGIGTITDYFLELSDKMLEPIVCLSGLGIILLIGLFCSILYNLQYYMIDRKLNLI